MSQTTPLRRPQERAIEALKRNDFETVLDILSDADTNTFALPLFLIKGLAELALQDWQAALSTFTTATERFPDHAAFWLNRGIAEENLTLIDEAITRHERCLALNPAYADAYGNLSNLHRKKKHFPEAEDMARLALANGASPSDALNSLALALRSQGKYAEAETTLRQAHQAAPENPYILLNQANIAVDQFHFDEAWPFFAAARAIQDTATFRHDEALARLLAGDIEQGLALYESRLELPRALRHRPTCPRWRGEDLTNKKLLILAEQGFGDTIQFSRYGKFIPNAELIWVVPQPLVRLLSAIVHGTVLPESASIPPCDYYIPLMSLPWELKIFSPQTSTNPLPLEGRVREGGAKQQPKPVSSQNLADKTAHLPPPPTPHPLKIGLVWQGSPTHERNHERSIPLEQFEPLFRTIQADFYAPSLNATQDEITHYPITALAPLITDFADTATLLQQLDVLITVDTAIAHLAGTLGVPTYLLLSHCPDWRWGTTGENTDWYPSLTLLRQTSYGDWAGVIEQLTIRLKNNPTAPKKVKPI